MNKKLIFITSFFLNPLIYGQVMNPERAAYSMPLHNSSGESGNLGAIIKMTSSDQNKLSEEEFLKWKVHEPNTKSTNLNDSKIHCISHNSQETLGQPDIKSQQKISQIINFCKLNNSPNNNLELLKVINKVVEPDIDLIQWLEKKDTNLSELMNFLGHYHTANHKSKLNAWAFYFLTSQATNIALSFIKKEEEKANKKFDNMDLKTKETTLGQATPIIAKNFIKNVINVAKKFKLKLPKIDIKKIEPIIFSYLKEKFI